MLGREETYTDDEIAAVPCARCSQPSSQQFEICALDGRHVAICQNCDIALNTLALQFLNAPDTAALIEKYRARVLA